MNIEIENNDGDILQLPATDRYILQEWSGFAYPTHSIITEKAPNQYGSTVINKIYNNRELSIQFVIQGNNRQEVFNRRKDVIELLNPVRDKGVMRWIQLDGTIYEIHVELDNLQMPGGEAQGQTFQIVQLDLLATMPFWRSQTEVIETIAVDSEISVINDGGVETYPVYEITGPVTNPVIYNYSASSKVEINYDLEAGNKIIVDTAFGNKQVLLEDSTGNKHNILDRLDIDSVLSTIGKGTNNLRFEGLNTTVDTEAKVRFYERFIGV